MAQVSNKSVNARLEQYFNLCDRNKSGFIESEDLDDLCESLGIDNEAIKNIFAPLDVDGTGKISKDQFISEFAHIQQVFCPGEDLIGLESDQSDGGFHSDQAYYQSRRRSTLKKNRECYYSLEFDFDIESQKRRSSFETKANTGSMTSLDSPASSPSYNSSSKYRKLHRDSEDIYGDANFEDNLALLSSSCHARIQDMGMSLRDLPNGGGGGNQGAMQQVIIGLVGQLKQMEEEVEQLSDSMKKSSRKHSDHISHLQEEMEHQISRAEKTAYNLADEAATSKQRETEKRLESEILTLKDKLDDYKLLEEKLSRERRMSEQNNQLKRQIESLSMENVQLKNVVLDTQTGIASLRAEMAKMSHKFEQQQMQIAQEKETARTYQEEVVHLSRQLQNMHESNKRLHDTSDELSYALEQNQSAIRILSRSASPSNSQLSRVRSCASDEASLQAELVMAAARRQQYSCNSGKYGADFNDESDSGRYSLVGSGFASGSHYRGNEVYYDNEDEIHSDIVRPEDSISMVNCRNDNRLQSVRHSSTYESSKIEVSEAPPKLSDVRHASLNEEMQQAEERGYNSDVFEGSLSRKNSARIVPLTLECNDTNGSLKQAPARVGNIVPLNDHKHTARCDSNDTLNSEMSQETILIKPRHSKSSDDSDEQDGRRRRRSSRSSELATMMLSPQTEHGDTPTEPGRCSPSPIHFSKNKSHEELRKSLEPKNGHQYAQERQYRVVLAGDAAVGKSSFILQLCTGYFHNRITSTLGVDFHTKAFDIDAKLTNLQLWDTAGQERFRAMAKSYFRRADGAVLLYDVTYEQSFLHVRDWVETIEAGANRKIPIIICANKCDSIPECQEKGIPYVPMEDGETLAATYDATFMEVSAKEGDNVLEAIIELSRQLWIAEDEERTNGLKLTEETIEEEGKCCK
ncbi:ras and EF-hand domain-containing protein homolog isoform X2 [Convolutriloba macropyga]|uniref:ras and EF-hand domain-containing protein homolog isoform X2 n=1 Tax=Convolutriloba macropyga TaxID=536237 RepID=UPI003F51D5FC